MTPSPCDCCDAVAWTYLFSEGQFDLGRCAGCGLHYVAQMPEGRQHMTELEAGHFGQTDPQTRKMRRGEALRRTAFQAYCDLVRRWAPPGTWLDIGCGTGALMQIVHDAGVAIEGIELAPRRAMQARQRHVGTVYAHPSKNSSFRRRRMQPSP